jgi:hypothetical protein
MNEAGQKNPETEKAWAKARIEQAISRERVAIHSARMFTIRTLSAYGVSSVFAIVGAALIIFAPESRETAANIVAAAFIVLALGIAGYSRFGVSAPGIEVSGEGKPEA